MASEPLTTFEAVSFLEKMDMTLDEIIKMSKKPTVSKGKRAPIKKQGLLIGNVSKGNARVQRYMDTRSSIRQGILAQRRSNFGTNQFRATKEIAKKAAALPLRNRAVSSIIPRAAGTIVQWKGTNGSFDGKAKGNLKQRHHQTMDALFANMKEQRTRTMSQQAARGSNRQLAQRRLSFQQRGTGRPAPGNNSRRLGNYYKYK